MHARSSIQGVQRARPLAPASRPRPIAPAFRRLRGAAPSRPATAPARATRWDQEAGAADYVAAQRRATLSRAIQGARCGQRDERSRLRRGRAVVPRPSRAASQALRRHHAITPPSPPARRLQPFCLAVRPACCSCAPPPLKPLLIRPRSRPRPRPPPVTAPGTGASCCLSSTATAASWRTARPPRRWGGSGSCSRGGSWTRTRSARRRRCTTGGPRARGLGVLCVCVWGGGCGGGRWSIACAMAADAFWGLLLCLALERACV
jgi:hypothetical protein